MIAVIKRTIATVAISLAACGSALAATPIGVWIDHTGRGAVEITDCGGKLCGRIVWVKDAGHNDGCNFQVLGDVKPVAGNKWDGGWIVDPEKDPDKKYDVEITPLSDQKLKVLGYIGTKFFSETMTWTRAPANLQKCGVESARPEPVPAPPGRDAEPPRREAERRDVERRDAEPPIAQRTPEPNVERAPPRENPGAKPKDCKLEFAGVSITFPCKELE